MDDKELTQKVTERVNSQDIAINAMAQLGLLKAFLVEKKLVDDDELNNYINDNLRDAAIVIRQQLVQQIFNYEKANGSPIIGANSQNKKIII